MIKLYGGEVLLVILLISSGSGSTSEAKSIQVSLSTASNQLTTAIAFFNFLKNATTVLPVLQSSNKAAVTNDPVVLLEDQTAPTLNLNTKNNVHNNILGSGLSVTSWTTVFVCSGFAVGVLFISMVAVFAYRHQKKRWNHGLQTEPNTHIPADLREVNLQAVTCHKDKNVDVCSAFTAFPENTLRRLSLMSPTVDVNKNIYERNRIVKQTVVPIPTEPMSSYTGENKIFVNQFWGEVTSAGGVIRSPESDVSLIVPPGAIQEGRHQVIYVNVSLLVSEFNIVHGDDEVQLAPIVECLAPGLNTFLKPVTIRLPHRAVTDGNDWQFRAQFSNSPIGSIMAWQDVPMEMKQNNGAQDVSFTYNNQFVLIKTKHFTTYTCSGCSKNKRLRLSTAVFGNYKIQDGHQQVNFRAYVCDDSLDAHKRLTQMERLLNGKQRSQFQPLVTKNLKNIEIEMTSASDAKWTWKTNEENKAVKIIPLESTFHCCGTPPSVNFVCRPKDDTIGQTGIEARFLVAQQRKKRTDMIPVELITHNFIFKAQQSKDPADDPMEKLMTTEQKEYVEENLLMRNVFPLARSLGLTDAQIDSIKHDFQNDLKEQIHQILSLWQRINGEIATLGKFCKALEKTGLKNIADELRKIADVFENEIILV